MAIRELRGIRALAVGLLATLLVVAGAIPVAAGPPGSARRDRGGHVAGQKAGEGREAGASRHASRPSAQVAKVGGDAPRPAAEAGGRHRPASQPGPPPAGPSPARPAKASQGRSQAGGPPPEAGRGVDAETPRPARSSADDTPQPASVHFAARKPPVRAEVDRSPRPAVRPMATRVVGTSDDSAALVAAPVVMARDEPAVDLARPGLWPTLPGAAGHPAFPLLLAAVLAAVLALGFRGDRRDPKLCEAAIDDRDDRARFR